MSNLTIINNSKPTLPTQTYCYSGRGLVKIQSMIAQENAGILNTKTRMVI